ncbi:MAG: hypothetical protein NZ580_01815 [Bacteroidia bacterium]|nr:hypothetical protein [Bacteroidia bacterium]MDW8235954.1 hypothetical protein [Bacteroidia bacterium]
MRALWLGFPLLLLAQLRLSQNPLSGPCRLSEDSLRPITPLHFPYLYQYQWEPRSKTEILWLSPTLQLRIEQRACIRHHITYELRIPASYPLAGGLTRGLMNLLDTLLTLLHRENIPFLQLKKLIWPRLIEQISMRSLGEIVMLPYQEWNFLLRIDHQGNTIVATLETIKYLSTGTVQKNVLPDYMDDALEP